ncbi:MAG: hypothetical protein MJE77_18055 [Proteobacteria bacterium]|nr:hypothetical protein [Pseudomonadota bacterium]
MVRFGVPESDVEDVTQQVFLIAYRRMQEIDGRVDNVTGWLRGVVVRVVSGHHRWRKVRRVKQWLVDTTMRMAASHPVTPERNAVVSQIQAQVNQVLAQLSPSCALWLHAVHALHECNMPAGHCIRTPRARRRYGKEEWS